MGKIQSGPLFWCWGGWGTGSWTPNGVHEPVPQPPLVLKGKHKKIALTFENSMVLYNNKDKLYKKGD